MQEGGSNAVQTILRALNEGNQSGLPWTPRRIGMEQALGGVCETSYHIPLLSFGFVTPLTPVFQFHPMPVGTPEMVADEFEKWVDIADVDGMFLGRYIYIYMPFSCP